MKQLLTGLLFCFALKSVSAQTFILNPGNVDTVYAPSNTLTIFDIYPINTTGGDIIFEWTRISVNLPTGWDYSFCDYGNCYTGIPTNGTMDTVGAGQQGLMGLNINPYAIAGQGIVKIYVYDNDFPNDGDTVTWVVNANTLGINEQSASHFSFYPNPSISYITIESSEISSTSNWMVYSISGEMLLNGILGGNKMISVENLPAGIYFLSVTDKDNRRQTVKFMKGE
jgi:hypothetical protein